MKKYGVSDSLFPASTFDEMREELVKKAIALLHEHCDGKRVLCAFSGGKDSQCCYHLLKEAGIPFDAQYSITRFEPPELLAFIREHYPDCKFRRAYKRTLIEDIEKRGLPVMWSRWCCDAKHAKTPGYDVVVIGIRAHESAKRARNWSAHGVKHDGQRYLCPVISWTEGNVWDYLNSRHIQYCQLYDEGYRRIGCALCPLMPSMLAVSGARYPKFTEVMRIGAARFVDRMRAMGYITKNGKPCSDWCRASDPEAEYFSRWLETGQTNKSVEDLRRRKGDAETSDGSMCIFAGTGFAFSDGVLDYGRDSGDGIQTTKMEAE